MSLKSAFALTTVALAIASAFSPVHAQSAPKDAPPATSEAQETLEAVTVTTRRREEVAQDVPAPLTVLRGSELAANHIERVQDLQQLLPSTNVAFIHARQGSVAVRGIGNNPAADGLDGSVGVYLDNVFLARPGMAVTEILDVDQLELLRGPQGTLFGKNTTAGVLNITTRKPGFETRNSVEVSAGQRGYEQVKATLSGPVNDSVAARLQVYDTKDDGDVTNLYNGQKLNGGERRGARGQLLLVPDGNFNLRLIADYNEEKSSYGTTVPYYLGPKFLAAAKAAGATGIPTDPSLYQVNMDSGQQSNAQQGGLSAEANWTLASGHRLTSITAARFWDFQPKNDDLTNIPGTLAGGVNVKDRQFSQELRLASPRGEHFDYVLGAFYFHQNLHNLNFTYYGANADPLYGTAAGTLANITTLSPGRISTDSFALFGQGTWHLTPRLDLTAGLRGTEEKKDASVSRNAPTLNGVTLTSLTAAQTPRIGPWSSGDLSLSEFSPSGLVNLAYNLDGGILAYATASHGEKSGGVNLGPATGPSLGASSLLVGPEKANNFELGIKSTLLDKRLFANLNFFQTRIDGYQANVLVANPNPAVGWSSPVSVLTNVGSLKSQGIELDVKALVTPGLTLSFNASYDDARYTDFRNAPCSVEAKVAGKTVCDLTGAAVVGAPRWVANLGGHYEWALPGNLTGYVNANYAWRSQTEGAIDDSQYARIPSYGLINLSTGWRGKSAYGGKWDASLWVRNLADKRYSTAIFQYPSYADVYTAAVGLPRTVGATLRYDF